jgi:hypothetical protein
MIGPSYYRVHWLRVRCRHCNGNGFIRMPFPKEMAFETLSELQTCGLCRGEGRWKVGFLEFWNDGILIHPQAVDAYLEKMRMTPSDMIAKCGYGDYR